MDRQRSSKGCGAPSALADGRRGVAVRRRLGKRPGVHRRKKCVHDAGDGQNEIDPVVRDRAVRHRGGGGFLGRLHQYQPARRLYRDQPAHPVVTTTREDDPSDTPAERGGCRAEERVDRRPREVLRRTADREEMPAVDDEMPVSWGEVDDACLDRLATERLDDRVPRLPAQDIGEVVRVEWAPMEGDDDGARKRARKPRQQPAECGDTARRCPDDDQVTAVFSRGRRGTTPARRPLRR